MNIFNEQLLERVKNKSLQWVTSATSNKQILQRVMSDFITSNEQGTDFNG